MGKRVVLLGFILLNSFILSSRAATWTIEKVTDNIEEDKYPFVVAVSSGLMVTYNHNDGDQELFLADNFSGSWTSSRITSNDIEEIVYDITANYDEQNANIVMMWQEEPDFEISFCSGEPGSWNVQRITDDSDHDQFPSLAIDQNGYIHMTFHKVAGDAEIFYVNNVSGSWVFEQVTDNTINDGFSRIALDSNGNPHIVFTDDANVWYQKKVSGIWTDPEQISTGITFTTTQPILAIDEDDYVHVTYAKSDGVDDEIYYASNISGSWHENIITTNDLFDFFPTLYIDPENNVHIVYLAAEPADAEIIYANNVSGVWSISPVTDNDVNDNSIFGKYFTCDSQGIGNVFFWNDSDGDDEIYHAYSNEPLYAGIEENPSTPSSSSITVAPILSSNSTIGYSVSLSGNVSLKIYDAAGSFVKTLVSGLRSTGEYQISWDGIDDAGIKAASGVYFFRLVTSTNTVSAKTILK